jgi:hypothetical protein
MRVAIEQDGGLGDVGFTPKKNSDPSYGFGGQKVCKVLKFTHVFCSQCGNNAIYRGSEYECIEMSKKRQTSVNNAERSGRRCTSTGRNESHGSRGWKSQCRRNCAKIKSEHIPYYTTALGSARFVQGGCLGNWQEDHKGRRMDMFSTRLKLYRSEAYSLDLVSSDFHLFEPIKEALRG